MNLLTKIGLRDVSRIDLICNLITILLIIFAIIYACISYTHLSETIPVHFNANGEVDRYGHKSSFIVLTAIIALMGIGLLTLSHFPQSFNYSIPITDSNREKQHALAASMIRQLNAFITICMTFMLVEIGMIAMEKWNASGIGVWFPILFCVGLILIIGNHLVESKKAK